MGIKDGFDGPTSAGAEASTDSTRSNTALSSCLGGILGAACDPFGAVMMAINKAKRSVLVLTSPH